MAYRIGMVLAAMLLLRTAVPALAQPAAKEWDVVVYGGTSAGVTAAVQAARMGQRVVLVEPGRHLGGMSSGGLGMTDIGSPGTIGGLADEFYARIYTHYLSDNAWTHGTRRAFFDWMPDNWSVDGKKAERTKRMYLFEPRVAEQVFNEMIASTDAKVVFGERLDLRNGVTKDGLRIVSITTESGNVFRGKAFVDATYEGDLLATAGVKYMVGREPNSQYGETLNGKFPKPPILIKIDPFVKPGDPASGLLPPVVQGAGGQAGEGDGLVQAYNFRMCLTDAPDNRVPIAKPANYDPLQYELMARLIESRRDKLKPGPSRIGAVALGGKDSHLGLNFDLIPNRKTDSNDGSHFGTDLAGASQGWPEGDYATREAIFNRIKDYQLGLLWFLGNDPRVPDAIRAEVSRWGLAKDEFTDSGNWPFQLYVREARRMVSDYVMTEHDAKNARTADDSVALASYPLDSHSASYFVDEKGQLFREPGFYVKSGVFQISYRSIRPRAAECSNLLVGGCISSTHAAYGSVRMEPVFMMLGQAAGAGAALVASDGVTAQDVPYAKLREHLLANGAILSRPTTKPVAIP